MMKFAEVVTNQIKNGIESVKSMQTNANASFDPIILLKAFAEFTRDNGLKALALTLNDAMGLWEKRLTAEQIRKSL